MDQLRDLADDRLITACIYCGAPDDTVDHVPSRVFLDEPFPANLPVVPACFSCNNGFSRDEEYVACVLESVIAGSTDPERIRRVRVAKTLRRSERLRGLIESGKREKGGILTWDIDIARVENVILKLARGHAAFELSAICRDLPNHIAFKPVYTLTPEEREAFEAPDFPQLWGEVGSRSMQRIAIAQVQLIGPDGEASFLNIPLNEWIDVQDDRYRYLTMTTHNSINVRFVIAEYLACEVSWLVP